MRDYPVIEIDGKTYVSEATAAKLLKKSTKTISRLVTTGNLIRPFVSRKVGSASLILEADLFAYPFTRHGPHSTRRVYHYNKRFEKKACDHCSAGNYCPEGGRDA